MSLTFDQWMQIANVTGTWVAGLGTLAAVVVSLWLARRSSRVDLKVKVAVYWIINPGVQPKEECVGYEVVNVGERAAIIDSVGWAIGGRKSKQFAMQMVEPRLGATVPKRLEHGERASFMFSLKDDWPSYFAGKFIESPESLASLRAIVTTTVGRSVEVKPEPSLLNRLKVAANKRAAKGE